MIAVPEPVQQISMPKPANQTDASFVAERKRHQSELLDVGLKETFPASDPVSIVLVR